MSAKNLSLYGYQRETTPNLARLAARSTVYHSHYSTSNFTSPGTATTLTGMYPWKHRAFNQGGMVKRNLVDQNIFNFLGAGYHRTAFSQNLWADILLEQFYKDIDTHLAPTSFSVSRDSLLMDESQNGLAWHTFPDFLLSLNLPASLVGGYLNAYKSLGKMTYYRYGFPDYPKGIPNMLPFANVAFRNEDVFAGVTSEISALQQGPNPYFAYFHFFSPHEPYKVNKDYLKLFHDDYKPVHKPIRVLGGGLSDAILLEKRLQYDQLTANVDDEFGQLLDFLENRGVLQDSYLVITSDHGQLFERGEHGHSTPLLYEPVIQIPLIIYAPGQTMPRDVYAPTSNIDLVPTLLSLAGKEIPVPLDGKVLPGFGGLPEQDRSIYSMVSYENSAFFPLTKATIAMRKGDYKLIHYLGYPKHDDLYELYNIQDDPEELKNLVKSDSATLSHMKEEMLAALDAANKPYRK
jgi:arylsulfatase A-like enzyme